MTGFKEGTGSDPFADDDEAGEPEVESGYSNDDAATQQSSLPWIYARDTAKDDRSMTQFFLQESTETLEGEAQRELEQMLDEDVRLLDMREAAYLVALANLEDVADQLREWGYDA